MNFYCVEKENKELVTYSYIEYLILRLLKWKKNERGRKNNES